VEHRGKQPLGEGRLWTEEKLEDVSGEPGEDAGPAQQRDDAVRGETAPDGPHERLAEHGAKHGSPDEALDDVRLLLGRSSSWQCSFMLLKRSSISHC
jgi:hypothetical protein